MQNWGAGDFVLQVLTFDIVIATRNRADALAVSIPLMLNQSRQPKQLIIIDSSDDHDEVRRVIDQATEGWDGKVIVEKSSPGTPYQRSRGLSLVTADIALIPDDDSLFFADAFDALMAIYERDTKNEIVAVAADEVPMPPEAADLSDTYQSSEDHLREARARPLRYRIEKRLKFLNPRIYLGFKLTEKHPLPGWLGDMHAIPAAYMTGFRMSFRTSAIKDIGFDTTLTGYSLEDDTDASFVAAQHGHVVVAKNSKVFHHRAPSGRGNGFRLGRTRVLNLLYVGLKHANAGQFSASEIAMIRFRLRLFSVLQLMICLTRLNTITGRERLAGTWAALRSAGPLWRAAPEELSAAYARSTELTNARLEKLKKPANTSIVSP